MDYPSHLSFPDSPPLGQHHLQHQASTFESENRLSQDHPWIFDSDLGSQTALALPPLSSMLEDALSPDYHRVPSPSAFLLARPSDSGSQPRPSISPRFRQSTPPYVALIRRNSVFSDNPHSEADYCDFDVFDGLEFPATRASQMAQPSSIVDLTDSPPAISQGLKKPSGMLPAAASSKRRQSATQLVPTVKRQRLEYEDDIEAIDLVDIDNDASYAEFSKKESDKRRKQKQQDEANKPIKLSEFQCIICLDNPTDLTVTWCGHLFCSQCLFEALHAGTGKKVCPICRQTISTTPSSKDRTKPSAKGVFPLAMKLMTAKRRGKQAAKHSYHKEPSVGYNSM